ncbi:nucleic acid-binding protein [Guyanagaster necrorhizus]|uniref:Single-stranded DNA-binding protein n=1 Tax=Guyanagaster necrorhizus TaxID=856835 RepID=A0A9P8AVA8_9AGAR|nr:nucleic acid-binding protein [Guyanagaster necrorhizus MCA 3950]KAG7448926.1 nucleic acid-binding protein [Guyanagaster necrorhizus MCA 3950]
MAKLVLIGNLGGDPETRSDKNDTPYVTYTVATQQFVPAPADSVDRPPPKTTWHRVFSFNENTNKYLSTLRKGSKVYVEAGFELRETPVEGQNTPQRSVFLKHESIKVVSPPKQPAHEESPESHE